MTPAGLFASCGPSAPPRGAAPTEMVEALRTIADEKSGWRFRVDPLEHARSVIEEMREVAARALAAHGEVAE